MLGVLCYCELGTMIPKSGGEFVYILEGLVAPITFLYSWTSTVLLKPAQSTSFALAFEKYVAELFFPLCISQELEQQDLNLLVKMLAAWCIGEGLLT